MPLSSIYKLHYSHHIQQYRPIPCLSVSRLQQALKAANVRRFHVLLSLPQNTTYTLTSSPPSWQRVSGHSWIKTSSSSSSSAISHPLKSPLLSSKTYVPSALNPTKIIVGNSAARSIVLWYCHAVTYSVSNASLAGSCQLISTIVAPFAARQFSTP